MNIFEYYLDRTYEGAVKNLTMYSARRVKAAALLIKRVAADNHFSSRPNQTILLKISTVAQRGNGKQSSGPFVRSLVKRLDAVCGLCCLDEKNKRFNSLPLPTLEQARAVMEPRSLPIDSCPLPHLVVWALHSYRSSCGLSKGNIRTAITAVLDLYELAVFNGRVLFNLDLIDWLKAQVDQLRIDGALAKTKYGCLDRGIEVICSATRLGKYVKPKRYETGISERFRRTKFYECVTTALNNLRENHTHYALTNIIFIASKLLQYAARNGIEQPTGEVLQAFVQQKDHLSEDMIYLVVTLFREMDRLYNLRAVHPLNGMLLNEIAIKSEPIEEMSIPAATDEHKISVLVAQTREILIRLGLTDSSIGQYQRIWRLFMGYAVPKYGDTYIQTVAEEFVAEAERRFDQGQLLVWKRKIYRRAMKVLQEVVETGEFSWHSFQFVRPHLPAELEEIRTELIQSLRLKGLSESRLQFYSYVVRAFCLTLGLKSERELRALQADSVIKVSNHFRACCSAHSLTAVLTVLRAWYQWLFGSGYLTQDFSTLIVSTRHVDNHVVPYFTEEDELKLRAELPRLDNRLRAIILLALDLGMRNGDILNLRLSNIDWQKDQICLIQHKTGVKATYPLLDEVGNALFDYLQNDRPQDAEGDYVFVRKQAPHLHFVSAYCIVEEVFRQLGIKPENGHGQGLHTLRHTFTRRLLSSGKVPHQMVTDALGHKSNSADKHYRSMEDDKLRLCALDLSEIGSFSWEDL